MEPIYQVVLYCAAVSSLFQVTTHGPETYDSRENGTVLGMAQLGDQERSRAVGNSDTKAEEETGGDEHLEIDRGGLENDGEDHDDGADADTPSSAHTVGNVGSDGQSEQRTEEHDTGEETLDRTGGVLHVCG